MVGLHPLKNNIPLLPLIYGCTKLFYLLSSFHQLTEVSTMKVLFVLYAGLIPLVPLIGVEIYRKREDKSRKLVCLGLFALQLMISTISIITYL